MYGSLETIHRGNFVRKCVADAKGKDKEIVSEPNILCEKCAKAFKINQYSGDHYTLPGVIESADNGCHLCILLLNHIPPKNWDQLQLRMKEGFKEPLLTLHVKRQEFVKVQSRSYEQMELRLMEDLGLKKRPPTEILQDQSVEIKYYVELSGFKIDPHKLMPFRFSAMNPAQFGTDSFKLVLGPLQPDTVPVCPSSIFTSSDESLAQVTAWIKHCSESHPLCARKLKHALPTRLIDVGVSEMEPMIRVIESKNISPQTQYVTLSHCWGKAPLSKLLKENYEAFKEEIPDEVLPKTFLESIFFTRRIGLRYIWIDALCILQNSPADWKKESGMMGQVYSNSFLNIAASASSDGRGGLFRRRDPLGAAPCIIKPSWPSWSQDPLVCYDQVGTYSEVHRSVLQDRAWVMQERLLAPRAANFTEKQIWWTCRTTTASESYPDGYAMEDNLNKWNLWKETTIVHGDAERGMLLCSWDKIVLEYTRRKMTFESDKLVAISGLAKEVNKEYGGMIGGRSVDYFAGLWSVSFTRGLLWSTKGVEWLSIAPEDRPRRPKDYRAPSWSWASIEGPTAAPNESVDTNLPAMVLINVPVAQTIPIDFNDPYGPVKHGFILIAGPLCKVPAGICMPSYQLHPFHSPGTSPLAHKAGETFIFWDDWTPAEVQRLTSSSFYLMGCQCVFTGPESLMYGLVLMPTGPKGQFRRVGYFDYLEPQETELKHPWHNIMRLLGAEPPKSEFYDTKYLENGVVKYTFSIV